MAPPENLRDAFVASAQALFNETGDGVELYHLIHQVVHVDPSRPRKPEAQAAKTPPAHTAKAVVAPRVSEKAKIKELSTPLIGSTKTPRGSKSTPTKSKQAAPSDNITPKRDSMEDLLDKFFPKKTSTFSTPSKETSNKRMTSDVFTDTSPLKKQRRVSKQQQFSDFWS